MIVVINNINIAVRRHQDIGGPIERVWAIACHAGLAQGHQELSLRAELHDRLPLAVFGSAVADPDVVFAVHENSMGIIEHSGAEAGHEVAGSVELHDRREIRAGAIIRRAAAVKDPDALAIAIDIHPDSRAPLASLG